MPGLMSKLTRFARSPQGKRAMRKAQAYASSPEGKAKIAQARERFAARKGSTGRRGRLG
jgi:hypothetical protein